MKQSQKYVIDKLNELYSSFSDLKIRYEYRDYLSTHLIEILPFETFENNHDYLVAEMAIQDEFEALYGREEEILFISSDSLNEIRKVDLKLGYEIPKRVEVQLHTYLVDGLDLSVNQIDASYALAA